MSDAMAKRFGSHDEGNGGSAPGNSKAGERCANRSRKNSASPIREMGRDDNARRICVLARQWAEMEKDYSTYISIMRALLSLRRESFAPEQAGDRS